MGKRIFKTAHQIFDEAIAEFGNTPEAREIGLKRYYAEIAEDIKEIANGTQKTYTKEEFDEIFAKFEQEMEEKYSNQQGLKEPICAK